jgi:ABC-type phosphate transport system auxiliary subunit
MLLRVEKLLHSIYDSINSYSTQQEIADALKILEEADNTIANPKIDVSSVKPPSTNLNTKGRKSNKGVKSSTERLKISKEIYEEKLQKNIRKNEKDEKKNEEYERKKRLLEIEERHVALEQKKRKITVLVKDNNGSLIKNKNITVETPEIKTENQPSTYYR